MFHFVPLNFYVLVFSADVLIFASLLLQCAIKQNKYDNHKGLERS